MPAPCNQPLVVCWGMGQDSTGMVVGMWERGIMPKLIITAVAEIADEQLLLAI